VEVVVAGVAVTNDGAYPVLTEARETVLSVGDALELPPPQAVSSTPADSAAITWVATRYCVDLTLRVRRVVFGFMILGNLFAVGNFSMESNFTPVNKSNVLPNTKKLGITHKNNRDFHFLYEIITHIQ
jgi:hypothetical protein